MVPTKDQENGDPQNLPPPAEDKENATPGLLQDDPPAPPDHEDADDNQQDSLPAGQAEAPAPAPPSASLDQTGEEDRYAAIGSLDDETEEERWSERTSIITRIDHETYTSYAQDILDELVANVKTPEKKK